MEGIWAKHEQFHYQPGEEFLIQNLRVSEIDKENLMTHWHEELEIVYVIDCENTHYIYLYTK